MRKFVTIFVSIIIISSMGIVVAQDNGLTYNPNSQPENRTATQEFQYLHSIDGGETDPNQSSGTEEIIGFEINQDRLNLMAYGEGASGNDLYRLEMYSLNMETHQAISRYASPFADYSEPHIGPSVGEFTMYNASSDTRRIYPYGQRPAFATPIDGVKFVSDGDAELYTGKETTLSSFEVLDSNSYNVIPYVTSAEVNGTTKIVYVVDDGSLNRKVKSYDREDNTITEISDIWGFSGDFAPYQSFSPTKNDILTHRRNITNDAGNSWAGITVYHNYTTTNTSWAYFNIIGESKDLVAVNPEYTSEYNNSDSIFIFEKERLATMLETTPGRYSYSDEFGNGLARNYSSLAIPSPIEKRDFSRGFYQSGYWFFGNIDTDKLYVYSQDPFEHKYTINNAWTNVPGEDNHRFTGYETEGGSIHIVTNYDNTLTIYDSTIDVQEETGCFQYLMPSQLDMLPVAPTVCWIPIFTGIGILNTEYQWFILALLIAMPIAKQTRSDIATMATINGVLFVAMALDRLSPAIMAISLVTTVLLSVYGTRGSDVSVNVGGGDEI